MKNQLLGAVFGLLLCTRLAAAQDLSPALDLRANIARQFSNQFGLNFTKVRLTERGFAAK